MDKIEVIDELIKQSKEAEEASDLFHSTFLYEPHLIKILYYIKSRIEYKDEFVEFFKKCIDIPELIFWEVIMYCMRDLQWEEIKEKIQTKLNSDFDLDLRYRRILEVILEAYEEDWEESDLWAYYHQ